MDQVKAALRTAYLLELRHGPFSESEFTAQFGGSESARILSTLLERGYLVAKDGNGRRGYSLTEKGRGQIVVVLAGGVYDVLHLGHLAALKEARSLGDLLITVVATDITVQMLKGRKPIFPEEDRRQLVEGLKPVDRAILGYEDVGMGYEEILMEVRPDIVAFGYDQENLERSVREIIEKRNLRIRTVRLSKYDQEKYASSTSVRQKLSEARR